MLQTQRLKRHRRSIRRTRSILSANLVSIPLVAQAEVAGGSGKILIVPEYHPVHQARGADFAEFEDLLRLDLWP